MASSSNSISINNDDPRIKKRWVEGMAKAAALSDATKQQDQMDFILDRFEESITRLGLGGASATYDALSELHQKEVAILTGAVETYDAKAQQAQREAGQKVADAEARERDAVSAKEAAEAERDKFMAEAEALRAQVAEKTAENAELASRVSELERRIADMEEQESLAGQMLEQLTMLKSINEAMAGTSSK